MNNSAALLRTLVTYAICVPVALTLGYIASRAAYSPNSSDLSVIGIFVLVLSIPFLLRWHHILVVFCLLLPVTIFFLPGHPSIFLPIVGVSLGISLLQRAMNPERHFIRAPEITRPLLFFLAVIFFTAKLTGGIGLHSMGSEVMGGKKYITLFAGILAYFALTARTVPPERAWIYLVVYFVGGAFMIVGDTVSFMPAPLYFIYNFLPLNPYAFTGEASAGILRLTGVGYAATCFFSLMLARYGVRGIFLSGKLWRPVVFLGLGGLVMAGGFRSQLFLCGLTCLILFFFVEKLHRTKLLPIFAFIGIFAITISLPFAGRLPLSFQRAISFLPLDNLDPVAVQSADATAEWRFAMWKAVLPQVPEYLLLGKGYALSQEDFQEMGLGAKSISAADWGAALAGDYHNGPLSVIIPFGIWGTLAVIWFFYAGARALYKNYKNGDPTLQKINAFLFAAFLTKIASFLVIFGGISSDMQGFTGILGLSICFNGGIKYRTATAPADKPAEHLGHRPPPRLHPALPTFSGRM